MDNNLKEIKEFIESYEEKKKKKPLKAVIKKAISEHISFILFRKTKEQEREEAEEMAYKRLKNIIKYIENEQRKEENNLWFYNILFRNKSNMISFYNNKVLSNIIVNLDSVSISTSWAFFEVL